MTHPVEIIYITGPMASGKTTIARGLRRELTMRSGTQVVWFDEDYSRSRDFGSLNIDSSPSILGHRPTHAIISAGDTAFLGRVMQMFESRGQTVTVRTVDISAAVNA